MNNNIFWSSIKFILLPHYSNIYDLRSILEKTKINLDDISDKNIPQKRDPYEKLAVIALSLFRPIARGKFRSVKILKKDLENWFNATIDLLRIMIEIKKNKIAKSIIRRFLSKFFYLLTIYTVWSNPLPSNRVLFGRGEFEKGALDFLLQIPTNKKFNDIINNLDLSKEIRFIFASYAITLQNALETTKNPDPDLMKKLEPILSKAMNIDDILAELENIGKRSKDHIRNLIYDVIYIITAMIKQKLIKEKTKIEELKRVLSRIGAYIESTKTEFEDIIWKCTLYINNCIEALFGDSIHDAVNSLRELGAIIINEKSTNTKLSERLLLRIHPETFALLPALIPININLVDELTNVSLNYFLNDLINETLGTMVELRILLSSILILDKDTIYKFLMESIRDPLASVALHFILGSLSAWLLESSITLSGGGQDISLLSNAIYVLYQYLKNIYELSENILKSVDSPLSKKIILSYLLREFTFLAMRLNEDAISLIKKAPKGKELMNLIEKISQILEEIFGATKEKKIERMEELIT